VFARWISWRIIWKTAGISGCRIPWYFNRGLNIEVDVSPPAERVIQILNQIIEWRGTPLAIRVDNGPKYINGKLMEWLRTKASP
jgi:transposase InsO family protein